MYRSYTLDMATVLTSWSFVSTNDQCYFLNFKMRTLKMLSNKYLLICLRWNCIFNLIVTFDHCCCCLRTHDNILHSVHQNSSLPLYVCLNSSLSWFVVPEYDYWDQFLYLNSKLFNPWLKQNYSPSKDTRALPLAINLVLYIGTL